MSRTSARRETGNGVCSMGDDVEVGSDSVSINGKPVNVVKKFDYYIMNKQRVTK